jgi:hypothetical protein
MAKRQTNIEQGFDKEATSVFSTIFFGLLALLGMISRIRSTLVYPQTLT